MQFISRKINQSTSASTRHVLWIVARSDSHLMAARQPRRALGKNAQIEIVMRAIAKYDVWLELFSQFIQLEVDTLLTRIYDP